MAKSQKESKDEKKPVEKPAKKVDQNKEIMWVLIVMGVLLATILIVYFAIQSTKHFNYEGLSFSREKFDQIEVYHYYHYFNKTNQIYQYNLYLRGDPRDNYVPVEGGEIAIYSGDLKYITLNETGLLNCSDSGIAIAGLGKLFSDNKISFYSATMDVSKAQNSSIKYASCEHNPKNLVVQVEAADQTRVLVNGTCYKIQVANCEILSATEKFIVQAIADAKKYQSK